MSFASATTARLPAPALPRAAVSHVRHRRLHHRRLAPAASACNDQQQPERPQQSQGRSLLQSAALGMGALAASAALVLAAPGSAALAADGAKVGACLLRSCQGALTNCLEDGACVQNLVCLQLCSNPEDKDAETSCQIKCGDRFTSPAIEAFNSCAISEQKCVPQRVDNELFPVPPDCSLDNSFDLDSFQGRWYITAGLNPLFDTFPCQEHYFASPETGRLYAKINWRIPLSDPITGEPDFAERSTVQRFVQQDPAVPAVLFNGGNEFLHYEDTWYILASKTDAYVLVYYKGNNDAWRGYGGATVYTREASLPEEYVPELKAAAEAAGLDWGAFQLTDNSCPAHPPQRSIAERAEIGVERSAAKVGELAAQKVRDVEYSIEDDLRSFGRGFTVLERDLSATLRANEAKLEAEVELLSAEAKREAAALEEEAKEAGRLIRRFEMEARMGPWINWIPKSWRPIIMPIN